MPTTMRYVRYRCRNPRCLAEDTGKFFEHEPIPAQPIICWKCRSGFQRSVEDMIQENLGMWPVPAEEQPVEAPPEPSTPTQPS